MGNAITLQTELSQYVYLSITGRCSIRDFSPKLDSVPKKV